MEPWRSLDSLECSEKTPGPMFPEELRKQLSGAMVLLMLMMLATLPLEEVVWDFGAGVKGGAVLMVVLGGKYGGSAGREGGRWTCGG